MKKITKFLIIIIISMISVQAYGQFSVRGGLNLSKQVMEDDDMSLTDEFSFLPGFNVGAFMAFPVSDALSFETGALLNTKGFKLKEDGLVLTSSVLYVDVPLTVKGYYSLSDALKVYGTAGGYVGYALSGKMKMEYEGDSESEDLSIGNNDDDDYKALDFGATVGAGIEFGGIIVGLSYDLGLANISPYTENGTKINNNVIRFSVGYKFGM